MSRKKKLTEREEQRLVEDYYKGFPVKDIAWSFGVSLQTLYDILKRRGARVTRKKDGYRNTRRPSLLRRILWVLGVRQ